MLKPEQSNKKSYKPVKAGSHLGILIQVIDMGLQEKRDYNDHEKTTLKKEIRFTWELPNETREFDGVKKPVVIGASYNNSMFKLSKLRPVVEGMLGVGLRDDEAANFGMKEYTDLIGKPCSLTIMHKIGSDGNTYAKVVSVQPLMEGVPVPKQFNESLIYEIGTSSEEVFNKLPEFIRKQILKAKENMKPELSDVNRDALERIMGGDNKFKSQQIEEDLASEIPF